MLALCNRITIMYNQCFLCSVSLILSVNSVDIPIVKVEQGLLSGTYFETESETLIYTFKGIPYARPPIGELRFREPQPALHWHNIRPATVSSSRCLQYRYFNISADPVVGSEDCLYLNVYTPRLLQNATKLLPVIVFIHGGAFMNGDGSEVKPNYLVDKGDLVFVTFNYRLGPLGFLSTEDSVVPGNNGLKDQVAALEWINKNIVYFGGNPKQVTLAGMSAGGASVHLHYLSSKSVGLFQQGISLSGTALCPWVQSKAPKQKAKLLAHTLGCTTNNSFDMINCMRKLSGKVIVQQVKTLFMPWLYTPFSPFGPSIEVTSDNSFLSDTPDSLIEKGKVQDLPWITSVTTDEGLYPGAYFVHNVELLKELDNKWNEIVPHLLDYNYTVPEYKLNEVSTNIRRYYLGDQPVTIEFYKPIIEMISDRLFIVDAEKAAKLQASVMTSPVYFYRFAYKGKCSLSNKLCKCNENLGVSHGDDLTYIFGCFFADPEAINTDIHMLLRMTNLWLSFAHYGTPSLGSDLKINWTAVKPKSELNYLFIKSSNDIEMKSADLVSLSFWNSLFANVSSLMTINDRDEL